jgi:hypothetical protein
VSGTRIRQWRALSSYLIRQEMAFNGKTSHIEWPVHILIQNKRCMGTEAVVEFTLKRDDKI